MTWQEKKLGDIATFINGKAFKPSDWSNEGLPIIRIQNLTNSINDIHYYNGNIEDKYRITTGDILISWSATIDVFEWLNGDAILNQHIFKVVFDKEPIDKNFFKYLIKQKISEMLKNVHGSTMKHITKGDFDNIKVILPSLEEQKRIAKILDKADEIRTKKRLANDKLDEFLKSTFIDLFGDPAKNNKGFDKIALQDIGNFKNGINYNAGDCGYTIKCIGVGDFKNGITLNSINNLNTVNISQMPNEEYFLRKNDIIFVRSNGSKELVGRTLLVNTNLQENIVYSGFCIRLRVEQENINNTFLLQLLNSKSIKDNMKNDGHGCNIKSLNQTILGNITVIVPPIELQNKFAKIVEKVEAQKQKNELVIEQMDNLFNSLSQRAFKGDMAKSNVIDSLTRQTVLHSKIIDKCNSHQTFGAVKLEKIFNLCDMIQELNLVPNGYYRKAAGPYVPEMRHTVEQELLQNNWVKITNQGNGKKVEYKKDSNFTAYKAIYNQIFNDKNQEIENIINYFYDKDTNYCEAFSTLYMCWNDLILEGKNPAKTEIIDEFKNHWAPEKQRFERIYLLEILSDMSNQGFEPQGHGVHTIESNYNHNKDQLSLQLK